jgi:hypothetical protein
MPLPSVNLDDRDFAQLVNEAKRRIAQSCPQWNDLSAGDPGLMLVELFAYLTENMIFRLNRLPQKAFIEFLRLLGVKLIPPSAARTKITFTLPLPAQRTIEIPQYTRITAGRAGGSSEPPVFITTLAEKIPQGATECTVEAIHAEMVEGELVGHGTGLPGLTIQASRAPLISGEECIVGVEIDDDEDVERTRSITYHNKTYRIWQEVENFANLGDELHVYIIDRMSGVITFTPSIRQMTHPHTLDTVPQALGEIVSDGKEIRLWYARGGGIDGNLDRNTLTVLKDPIPGVHLTVTNPEVATGGKESESVENALIRGPIQFRTLDRAVTAGDYEHIAKEVSGDVSRAHAFTKASIWKHALRGTVEILVVPAIPERLWNGGRVPLETLLDQQKKDTCSYIQSQIEKRSPLGITILVDWVKYKRVKVSARAVVVRGENVQLVRERVLDRLYKTINPLPSENNSKGWQFTTPLRVSNVYDIILAEPGVIYADNVQLIVDHAPSVDVTCIKADPFQEKMWYASSGSSLYRSSNDGMGWELMHDFGTEEKIISIENDKKLPGYVAVCTAIAGSTGTVSKIYLSTDCGESQKWQTLHQTAFEVEDIAWSERDNVPALLLAAENGLYELKLGEKAIPIHIIVDPQDHSKGFYSVEPITDSRGVSYVIASAKRNGGVFISDRQGRADTFSYVGLKGEDIRLLKAHHFGGRTFLWAGVTAAGNEIGKGCFRLELRGSATSAESWTHFGKQWIGGTCLSLAFFEGNVYAGTHNAGILNLDSRTSDHFWKKHSLDSGLPFSSRERIFERVSALDSDLKKSAPFVLAGGPKGVYRSSDFENFQNCSKTEFQDKVTVPPTWLLFSAEHQITVETENE